MLGYYVLQAPSETCQERPIVWSRRFWLSSWHTYTQTYIQIGVHYNGIGHALLPEVDIKDSDRIAHNLDFCISVTTQAKVPL